MQGDPHVRFDEQGVETERLVSPTGELHVTASPPDSTPNFNALATDLPKAKLTLGRPLGGAVQLEPAGMVLGIAEGIETAMSAARLLGIPVWAALGSERLHQVAVPLGVKRVLLLPDNDRAGHVAVTRAKEAYRDKAFEFEWLWPWNGLNDWSDVLMTAS